MKKTIEACRNLIWVLAAAFILAKAPEARALNIELRSALNDAPASKLDFETFPSSIQHNMAQQYLKIDYTDLTIKQIRVYTNNGSNWTGSPEAGLNGMILKDTRQDRIPLYWTAYDTPRASHTAVFNPQTEGSWKLMRDIQDPDFDPQNGFVKIPTEPGKTSYVYFATKVLDPSQEPGEYQTNFVIEVIRDAPDLKAPVISAVSCKKAFSGHPIELKAVMEDDAEVKYATVYYRPKGETQYATKSVSLTRNALDPHQWAGIVSVPPMTADLEYYYEASDGTQKTLSGTADAPHPLQIVQEAAEMTFTMTPQGGAGLDPAVCSQGNVLPQLTFSPGSIDRNTVVAVKKLEAQSLPKRREQAPVTAFEFTPHGLNFKTPVRIQLPYTDVDGDGVVDGMGLKASDLKPFWHDGYEWRNLGGTVDPEKRVVRAQVAHFSAYALFTAGPLSAEEVRPRENIISPNGDNVNDAALFGISGDFEISIYDTQGRLIRKIKDMNVWDGRDDDGAVVDSGVYVYKVKSSQVSVTGMLAVGK